MFQSLIGGIEGHLIIRDKHSGISLVDKKNAIHFGNMSWAVSQALAGSDAGHIASMGFGSGGTALDTNGNITYRAPNVSNIQDPNASMYNQTFEKDVAIEVISGTSNFSDLVVTTTLEFGEPTGQDTDNQATSPNGDYIFDEIALFTEPTTSISPRLITHVIFHPTLKAENVELEIEYTIRVQMGP